MATIRQITVKHLKIKVIELLIDIAQDYILRLKTQEYEMTNGTMEKSNFNSHEEQQKPINNFKTI